MGFFSEFSSWLNSILSNYIAANTSRIAQVLEPSIVTLGVLYIMVWGFLQLTGKIKQPMLEGLKRIAVLALIFGVGLQLWLYNSAIVDTFYNAPAQLAAGIIGTYDPVTIVDQIIFSGGDIATLFLQKAGVLNGNISYYIAAAAVDICVCITAVYTIFLLSLSRIALSILLALGPLFISLLFFDSTKRFVEAWLAQLANYAFVAILTVLVAALMLTLLSTAAQQAAGTGGNISFALAVRVCMAAGLTFLMMRQVPPMAAGLASGIALSSFGVVSGAFKYGVKTVGPSARRMTGRTLQLGGRGASSVARAAVRVVRGPNEIRPSTGRS
jgi:type IV secretion system protein VirB6